MVEFLEKVLNILEGKTNFINVSDSWAGDIYIFDLTKGYIFMEKNKALRKYHVYNRATACNGYCYVNKWNEKLHCSPMPIFSSISLK